MKYGISQITLTLFKRKILLVGMYLVLVVNIISNIFHLMKDRITSFMFMEWFSYLPFYLVFPACKIKKILKNVTFKAIFNHSEENKNITISQPS